MTPDPAPLSEKAENRFDTAAQTAPRERDGLGVADHFRQEVDQIGGLDDRAAILATA